MKTKNPWLLGLILLLGACQQNLNVDDGGGTTIPTAPTGLSITSGDSQARLSWTDVADAVKYNIYYKANSTTASKTDTLAAESPVVGTNVTIASLTNSVQYAFVVTAVNSAGEGAASVSATGTTIAAPVFTVPFAHTSTDILIKWPVRADANTLTLYWVLGTTIDIATATAVPISSPGTATTYSLTPLSAGTTYAFKLAITNTDHGTSLSDFATTTTLNAAPGQPYDSADILMWTFGGGTTNSSGSTQYFLLEYSSDNGATVSGHDNFPISNGQSYSYSGVELYIGRVYRVTQTGAALEVISDTSPYSDPWVW